MSGFSHFQKERIPGTPPWIVNGARVTSPITLANAIEMPHERRSTLTPRWDGKSLNTNGLSQEGIVHEAAHWLLSGPWRRTLPNFGLGASSHGGTFVAAHLPWRERDREEKKTVIIQGAAGIAMGLVSLDAIKYSSLVRWTLADIDSVRAELQRMNLLGDQHTRIISQVCDNAKEAARALRKAG